MFSSFKYAINQAKVDSLVGDKLLDETEKFFKHTQEVKSYINKPKSSLKRSNRRLESHIY